MPRTALVAVLLSSLALSPVRAEADRVDFVRDVHPILTRYCVECHGQDRQRGKLRLDSRSAALRVLAPGKSAGSELLRRVLLPADDPEAMPSRGARLSASQVERLRKWIDQGANWPEQIARVRHWSLVPPVRPVPPTVADAAWARHPIDRFVRTRQDRAGLVPPPRADRWTLIRRLSLDLVGLPPTPEEAEAFVNDARPDAYERLVDRLLADPAHGERWARPWLDLARYADSHGFQRDDLRDLWPFRDWVIDALNADLPFDRFTIEQVAGDLLPGATERQRIATGFHRGTPTNVEAGSDPEETRVNQVLDRVNTTGAVWLGVTLECAQCHDHKYDPFSQKDYYRLFAYFNGTALEADRSNPKVPGSIRFLGPSLKLSSGASTLVMKELPTPRPTHLFRRGDFRTPGERIEPGVPAVLHRSPAGPGNRLTLARWLVARDNPLTARVHVNRVWSELFGRGIVATPEDFGVKGEPPSHPELLDWLAVEFMDSGWQMKHLLRLIVTSRTYQQSSRGTRELRRHDPDNRLLARGPRFRLDAETIRDSALAMSGLLSRRMGGAPVRPPQPTGLWNKVGGAKVDYKVSPGADRDRRGVYVVWKRASPYPSFVAFDATARLACTVRRSRSSTPLQALTLLNDPVYVEAAQALARRVLRERPESSLEDRLAHAFRLCLVRPPTSDERAVLRQLFTAQRDASTVDPTKKPTDVPAGSTAAEFSAWSAVATVLLNLDETITRE